MVVAAYPKMSLRNIFSLFPEFIWWIGNIILPLRTF